MKTEFGDNLGLKYFTKIMEDGLKKSYGSDFKKGVPSEFVELVGKRDDAVGLKVAFPQVEADKIVYQFFDDPMPNLKGQVSYKDLDACYLNFKVSYLLGNDWEYRTTKHLWNGDECSEHVIEKIK